MINVIPDRCQPWRYKKAECRLCLEACPVDGCISFADNAISVNNEVCMDCGICTTVCPTGVLSLDGLNDRELLERLEAGAKGKGLFLACSLGPDKRELLPDSVAADSSFVKLPCLAILKESHLAALALSGVSEIALDCGDCPRCSFRDGKKTIEKTVSCAKALLSGIGREERIKIQDAPAGNAPKGYGLPGKNKRKKINDIVPGPVYSRRELFTFFKDKAGEKAKEKLFQSAGPAEEVFESEEMPQRRTILVSALKKAGPPAKPALREGEFPVHQLGISKDCVMCARCDAFCPTGALKRVEGDGEVSIGFQMNLCAGCYQCREFCPTGAIYYQEEIGLDLIFKGTAVTLMKKDVSECPGCGRPFLPDVDRGGCPVCAKRQALDKKIFSVLFGN